MFMGGRGSPGLQVAMETQQDAMGVAVEVEQRRDQSRQTTEPIHLQEETLSGLIIHPDS